MAGTSAAEIAAGACKGRKSESSSTTSGKSSAIIPCGGLGAHEKAGGHLIERHVCKTEAELVERVANGRVDTAASFTDRAAAESITAKVIDSNQLTIKNYASGNQAKLLVLDYTSSTVLGFSVTRGATNSLTDTNTRIVIIRDLSMPGSYGILTGYPTK